MWHMRTTSIRGLHANTSELVREAAAGGVIVIENEGEPIAELRPITTHASLPAAQKAQIFESMLEIWARMPEVSDSTDLVSSDRDR
jgi:antitoxin (DNA-binding transcriptional repressor) of toxin-antitoxin stability system